MGSVRVGVAMREIPVSSAQRDTSMILMKKHLPVKVGSRVCDSVPFISSSAPPPPKHIAIMINFLPILSLIAFPLQLVTKPVRTAAVVQVLTCVMNVPKGMSSARKMKRAKVGT